LAALKQAFKTRKIRLERIKRSGRAGRFHLTNSWPSIFFSELHKIVTDLLLIMKKILIPSMLICFAMICSCQKQDSAAEEQLAQQKTALDARESTLDEREKELNLRETALNERENALAKKEKAAANARTIPPDVQPRRDGVRDAAEAQAERDRKIQQLPPEIRALIPDPSQVNSAKAEKDRMTRERLGQRQYKFEQTQKAWTSGAATSPAAEATSPTPSPAIETTPQ
jgi:hypothetical protein